MYVGQTGIDLTVPRWLRLVLPLGKPLRPPPWAAHLRCCSLHPQSPIIAYVGQTGVCHQGLRWIQLLHLRAYPFLPETTPELLHVTGLTRRHGALDICMFTTTPVTTHNHRRVLDWGVWHSDEMGGLWLVIACLCRNSGSDILPAGCLGLSVVSETTF